MLYAYSETGEKIRATPKAIGFCGDCKEPMTSKCGEQIIWHWAHKPGASHEVKEETEWHKQWKQLVPKEWCEVPMGEHRADIRLPNLMVIEFQHSNISEDDVNARQDEYKTMIWVLDGREGEIYSKARDATFARFVQYYVDCGDKMYFYDHSSDFYIDVKKDIFVEELKVGRIYDYSFEISNYKKIGQKTIELNNLEMKISEMVVQHSSLYQKIDQLQSWNTRLYRENKQKEEEFDNSFLQYKEQRRKEMENDIEGEKKRLMGEKYNEICANARKEAYQYLLTHIEEEGHIPKILADIRDRVQRTISDNIEHVETEIRERETNALSILHETLQKAKSAELQPTKFGYRYCSKCLKEYNLEFTSETFRPIVSWDNFKQECIERNGLQIESLEFVEFFAQIEKMLVTGQMKYIQSKNELFGIKTISTLQPPDGE